MERKFEWRKKKLKFGTVAIFSRILLKKSQTYPAKTGQCYWLSIFGSFFILENLNPNEI